MLKVNAQKVEQMYQSLLSQKDNILNGCKQSATEIGLSKGYAQKTIDKLAEFIASEEFPELEDINNKISFIEQFMEESIADNYQVLD